MTQQNPLEELILNILNENGFDKLDDESKKTYLPQFMAQAEQRLGAALLPHLNEESANLFVELTKKQAKPSEWLVFWHEHVANFDSVVKETLGEFAAEVKESFQL